MRSALMHSVRAALVKPLVLDIDASIKPLYGHQAGAELGYNPTKPKRPSHVLHTFWVGNLRLVMDDVQVSSGKQHTSVRAKAALGRLLEKLGDKRPAMVRGDSGYGNEGILLELEGRHQPYLLRLRQKANVQHLVARQFERQDWSRPDNQGCQMVEDQLQLHGWSKKHRAVIVRQRIRGRIARERRVDGKQLRLDLAGPSVHEGDRLWEYAVMGNQGPGLPFWICFPISAGSYSAEGMEALPSSKRTATWPTSLVITGPVTRVGKLTIDDTLRRSCKVMNADTSKSRTKISRKPINHQFK